MQQHRLAPFAGLHRIDEQPAASPLWYGFAARQHLLRLADGRSTGRRPSAASGLFAVSAICRRAWLYPGAGLRRRSAGAAGLYPAAELRGDRRSDTGDAARFGRARANAARRPADHARRAGGAHRPPRAARHRNDASRAARRHRLEHLAALRHLRQRSLRRRTAARPMFASDSGSSFPAAARRSQVRTAFSSPA